MVAVYSDTLLIRQINEVLEDVEPSLLTFSIRINSVKDTEFELIPFFISNITIEQMFEESYTDNIIMTLTITAPQLVELYEHRNDLRVMLRTIKIDNAGISRALAKPLEINYYKAIYLDHEDLKKKVQNIDRYSDTLVNVSLQLIDETVYENRHSSIHGIFQKNTVEDVIRFIANSFGYTTINLYPPDNKHVYDHLVVPPNITFEHIWKWIQERYGVYTHGITSYVYLPENKQEKKAIYIYPPYLLKLPYKQIIHLYPDDPGGHGGVPSRHKIEDPIISIVLDGMPNVIDKKQLSDENESTGFMWMRGTSRLDGNMSTTNDGSFFTREGGVKLSLDQETMNLKYEVEATDNFYKLMSKTVKNKSELVSSVWPNAVTGILKPGARVKYFNMDEDIVKFKEGILSGCVYTIDLLGHLGGGWNSYMANSSLIIRLDRDRDMP